MKSFFFGCLLAIGASTASAQSNETPYSPHLAGQTVACSDFKHDADGAWTTIHPVSVQRENAYTTLAQGTSLRPGGPKVVGIDVGAMLDAVCRH